MKNVVFVIQSMHSTGVFSDTGLFGVHAATEEADIPELVPVVLEQLKKAGQSIEQDELDRARAQINAGLMMSQESPASRAGQIARQILLFGRPISNAELMDRLNALTTTRLRDLADRLFTQSVPTIAALGPVGQVPGQAQIAETLGARLPDAAQ